MIRIWRIRSERVMAVTSAALLASATGTAIWLCLPLEGWAPPTIDLAPEARSGESPVEPLKLSDLAVIWQRDLRQPLEDPPPPNRREPTAEPKLDIKLVGTAIERDRQYAVFGLGDNRTLVRPVGADIEGYRVLEITRGCVLLQRGARQFELKVPWYDRIAARAGE